MNLWHKLTSKPSTYVSHTSQLAIKTNCKNFPTCKQKTSKLVKPIYKFMQARLGFGPRVGLENNRASVHTMAEHTVSILNI